MGTQQRIPEGSAAMLLRKIERFLSRTEMSATRFGRLAARDPRFVHDLRRGRAPRAYTVARVESFMSNHLVQGEDHNVR